MAESPRAYRARQRKLRRAKAHASNARPTGHAQMLALPERLVFELPPELRAKLVGITRPVSCGLGLHVRVARGSNLSRVNVSLDDMHAESFDVAPSARMCTRPRSLLITAHDNADPDPRNVTELLDAIPGAAERAELGLAQIRAGEGRRVHSKAA